MKTTRKYTMGARAQAVDATRRRIMDALIALAGERPFAEVTLDTIAERAGVSVQTVLRQFGSRDGLFAEAMDAAMVDAEDERRTLLMLAQEGHDDVARKATDRGKAMHRDWVREAFAPVTDDEALLDLLVVATDVYTWKLLRIDRGHSRAVTERRLHDLVDAVLTAGSEEH
jgi:AcrR family transcriptional regulator